MHKQMQAVGECRCGNSIAASEFADQFPIKAIKIKLLRAIILLVGLPLTSAALGAGSIKIGDINSYSAAPLFTEPYRKGWQLGVEEINAAGGVDGRMLTVISRDDGGQQSVAVRQARALLSRDKVDVLAGTSMSNIGLAVSEVARKNRTLFIAAEPMTDAVTWDKGSRYTFRLRPSTYMQAAMLAEEAARLPAKRWAMLAPNYEYGQSAVANFKQLLKARRPDIQFVAEQWPALNKIDAPVVLRELAKAKPDAIFNVTYGGDLVKFVRESRVHAELAGVKVVSMLAGEPENLLQLKGDTPPGWIVTGYQPDQDGNPEHERFAAAYRKKYGEPPQLGSIIGYSMIMAIAEGVRKAKSIDSEKLVDAMRGLQFNTPLGPVRFRAVDQQATLGAFVGRLEQKDGKGFMVGARYIDGAKFLPDDAYVQARRPAAAMQGAPK